MRYLFKALLPVLLITLVVDVQGRNFTDDRGVVFSWDDGTTRNPTIVVNANGAIALFHLGMTNDQILGVWDKWIIRGSEIDLDSNDLESLFAADPNRAELDLLKSVRDLSPECSQSPEGCRRQFDSNLLEELNPDFVVYLHHGPFPEITDQISTVMGGPPIYIDARFENGDGCRSAENTNFEEILATNCYARSVFDVIARTQELATFLGVDVDSNQQIVEDQQIMCEAANEFTLMAEQLHERGVRCVGATARMTGGGNVNLVNLNMIPWLRTFEELGLPLVHPPLQNPSDFTRTYTAEQWFPGCDRFGGDEYNCDGIAPLLPVDCWLFDSRSYPVIAENKEDILSVLSVEAIKQDQFSYLYLNDGAITYKTVAATLKDITEDLRNVQQIYMEGSDCTRVDVTSREHTSLAFGQLSGGEYACYDLDTLNQDMLTCPLRPFTPGVSSASSAVEKENGVEEDSNGDAGLQSSSSDCMQPRVVAMASLLLVGLAVLA